MSLAVDKVLHALDRELSESRRGDNPTTYSAGRKRDAALLLTLKGVLTRLEDVEETILKNAAKGTIEQ